MKSALRITFAILILYIPLACVSFNEFSDKKARLEQCQERNDRMAGDLEDMHAERLRHNEHRAILEAKLISSEEMAANCAKDISDLQAQHAYVKKINK